MLWPERELGTASTTPAKTHSVEFFDRAVYPADEIAERLTERLQRGWGAGCSLRSGTST